MSVYFAEVGRYIKIGYSQNAERRVLHLFASETRYGAPKDAPTTRAGRRLLKVIDGNECTERAVHLALDDFRVMGEWFIDEPEVRAFMADVQTAKRYPQITRPAGPFDRESDPVLRMSDAERAHVEWAVSRIFAGTSLARNP